MTHKFECPHCGQRVSATEEQAGTEVHCPACDGGIVVSFDPPSDELDEPLHDELLSDEALSDEALSDELPPGEPLLEGPPLPTVENLEDQMRGLGIVPDIPSGEMPLEDRWTMLDSFFAEVRNLRTIVSEMVLSGSITRVPTREELSPVFARMYERMIHGGDCADESLLKEWIQEEIPQIFPG